MLEILNDIYQMVVSIFDFLIYFVESIFNLVKILPSAMSFLIRFLTFIPPTASMYIAGLMSLSIVFIIVGRNS